MIAIVLGFLLIILGIIGNQVVKSDKFKIISFGIIAMGLILIIAGAIILP